MIPVYKLQKLHFSQKVRKIAKEVQLLEITRFSGDSGLRSLLPQEKAWLRDAVTLLLSEPTFFDHADHAEKCALEEAARAPDERTLSTFRHVLSQKAGGKIEADWDFIDRSDSKPDKSKRRIFAGMQVFLEDIRSPFNTGAIFRSAENFGAEKIFLSPLCASPRHPRAERSAKGCIDLVDYETASLERLEQIAKTTDGGIKIFALETGGCQLKDFAFPVFPSRAVMLVGNEELGLSPAALSIADNAAKGGIGRVSIPMNGAKGSLNVAVSFGIVMHAWFCAHCTRDAQRAEREEV